MNNLWDAIRKRRVLVIIGLLLAVGLGTSAAIFGPRLFTGNQPAQAANAANTANATNKTDGSATSKPVGFRAVDHDTERINAFVGNIEINFYKILSAVIIQFVVKASVAAGSALKLVVEIS